LRVQGKAPLGHGCRSWTELFFLDEPWPFGGSPPLLLCRREAAELFRAAWAAAKARRPCRATIDAVLHRERSSTDGSACIQYPRQSRRFLMARLLWRRIGVHLSSGLAHRWTIEGYDPPVPLHRADGLLTPPSTLMALGAGYRPVLHPSITAFSPFSRDETIF